MKSLRLLITLFVTLPSIQSVALDFTDPELGVTFSEGAIPTGASPADQVVVIEAKSNPSLHNIKGTVVMEPSLTFLGSGTYNKKTQEALLIACVGDLVSTQDSTRKCDLIQFVLIDDKKVATWYSRPFFYGTKKSFNEKMKFLEKYLRSPFLETDTSTLMGTLVGFGVPSAAVAIISTGVGAALFGVAVLIVCNSRHGWRALDFITPLPAAIYDSAMERPFLATATQDGWNWSGNAVKMRPKKFEKLKRFLQNHDEML